jgi:hypothetical protein
VNDRHASTDTQYALTRPDCTVSHSKQVAFRLDTHLEEFVPGTAGPTVSRRPERYTVETSHITGHEFAVIASEAPVLAKLDAQSGRRRSVLLSCTEYSDDGKMEILSLWL